MRVKCEEAQKSEEEQVCQKIVTLENALSKGDSELCHKLFVENPSALTTLQRHMLFQEFPAEYLDLARKVFHDLSGNTISNQGEGERTVFQLQIALAFLKLELQLPKWYFERRQLEATFSNVINELLSNSTTIVRILTRGNAVLEQQHCKLCESAACMSQIDQLVYSSLIELYELLNQAICSGTLPPSVYQKILTFAYFGLDTKKQSIASSSRSLIAFIFELLPSCQNEIMWRTVYSCFEIAELSEFGQLSNVDATSGRFREEITNVLRLLNISGCFVCNTQERRQLIDPRRGCCLQRIKPEFSTVAEEEAYHASLTAKCDILIAYLHELTKKVLSSSKKKAILNFIESLLTLFPDLLFPSAFFLIASLFQWCLEVLKNCSENSPLRMIVVEILVKISVRFLEIQREHRGCKRCSLITERDRAYVLFDANAFHLEQLAPHALGCWVTVLRRISKRVNVVFEETEKKESFDVSNSTQLSLKEVACCSAASCSLTKAGPCQTVEALLSALSVASHQERLKVIQSIKLLVRTDPKFFIDLKWVEDALLLLSRDPAASVRSVALELGLQFCNVRHLSGRKFDNSTYVKSWAETIIERLRDSSASVRKIALYFAKMFLIFFVTTNSPPGSVGLKKKLFRQVFNRLEDHDVIVRETCTDCLEEYFRCAYRKISSNFGSAYEIEEFYHEIIDSLNTLKSRSSSKLLFNVAAKINGTNASLMESLTKYAMSIVAKTFQNVCNDIEHPNCQIDERYHLATLFLEIACEWDPEYTAPYERYLLSCLEFSLYSKDVGVHVVSNVICLLSSLYESTPAGLEGAKKFFNYLEFILTNNLCPVLGNAVMKSLNRLCKIPAFRVEVEELVYELLTVAKNQTFQWQATPDGSDTVENTWKVISTIFSRIASMSTCVTSKTVLKSIRRAMLWFFDKIFSFLRSRLENEITLDEAWVSTAMEAALIYLKCDCSYISCLRESITLMLQSQTVLENQKLSLLFTLQTLFSDCVKELQNNVNENVTVTNTASVEFFGDSVSLVDSFSVLVQQLLNVFVDMVFSRNILIRNYVCGIICQCVLSGIVVPIEVIPSLFCFTLDDKSQPDIRERAMSTLKFIAQYQQEMIASRLVEGLHNAWKFWKVTLNSDWNSLVDKGSDKSLYSRLAAIFSFLPSNELFVFIRTMLDEIMSKEEDWQFNVFCAIPLLFLDPCCILPSKGQKRRSSNSLEEMKLITDKCMQLVATSGAECIQNRNALESCTESCTNSIRLYLIMLVYEKFQILIQAWNKNEEIQEKVLTVKTLECWEELMAFGDHISHQRILSRISTWIGDGEGLWDGTALNVGLPSCDKENCPVSSKELDGPGVKSKKMCHLKNSNWHH